MNIYLFGNNEKINHELIKKFNFQSNDLIVLFNKSILLKFPEIKNFKNKVLYLRQKTGGFWGYDEMKENKDLYKNIYFVTVEKIFCDEKLEKKIFEFKEIDKIFGEKIPQLGFIVYQYYKNLMVENSDVKIFLIGFTNTYISKPLWERHSKEIEQEYYKNELLIYKNLFKIDC
jgi:hypothetical protein